MTFKGFRMPQIVAALQSSVEFAVEMPEAEERGVVVGAVWSVATAGRVTAPTILQAITAGEEEFARHLEVPYVLVTSVSARHFDGMGPKEVDGSTIQFDRFLPEPFFAEHEKARTAGEDQVVGALPDPANPMRAYTAARVSVSGRSHQQAVERALDALDLLRGIWNLAINRNVGDMTSIGVRRPTNRLSPGPIHSLHHPDGRLADESPWLEPDYAGPVFVYSLQGGWGYVEEYEEQVWQELERIPYRRDLEAAIRTYARALDRRDWNTSFVRLWGVLETLTGTSRSRKETLESRMLFLLRAEDRPFHRQILRHLRRYRNRTVHAGHETEAIQRLLFQLKFYVEALLEFHLSADPAFEKLEEATRFLDLPKDPAELRESARRVEQALRLQEPDTPS